MKRLIFCFLLFMSLVQPAPAEQHESILPDDMKAAAQKAAVWLKKSPKRQREASLAEMAGLLFMEKGGYAYSGSGSEVVEVKRGGIVVEKVHVPFDTVKGGARFIGSDGKLYDYYETGPHASRKKTSTNDAWKQGKLYTYRAEKENVFPFFEKELADLEIKRSIYLLRRMPARYRQAMFAEILHLFYMENGSEPFDGVRKTYDFYGTRIAYESFKRGVKYLGADGKVWDYFDVWEPEKSERIFYWDCVKLCIRNHGYEKVFAPFRTEIEAMEKHYAEKRRDTRSRAQRVAPLPGEKKTPAPSAAPSAPAKPATSPLGSPAPAPMGTPGASPLGAPVMPSADSPQRPSPTSL